MALKKQDEVSESTGYVAGARWVGVCCVQIKLIILGKYLCVILSHPPAQDLATRITSLGVWAAKVSRSLSPSSSSSHMSH